MRDPNSKFFYLMRNMNSIGLSDNGQYLSDGNGKLVYLLIDVMIDGVAAGIPISWWSSSTLRGSIVFLCVVASSLIANYLSTRGTRMIVSE